jgi:hypothetical protein
VNCELKFVWKDTVICFTVHCYNILQQRVGTFPRNISRDVCPLVKFVQEHQSWCLASRQFVQEHQSWCLASRQVRTETSVMMSGLSSGSYRNISRDVWHVVSSYRNISRDVWPLVSSYKNTVTTPHTCHPPQLDLQNTTCKNNRHRAVRCCGNVIDLFPEGDCFECRPNHRLSWRTFLRLL